ncbi:MAG: S8 family serine peptidase [Planctomycetes bacterium]|nr:S8 family serine peptidase [Planctomycetota bacterium]
METLRDLSGHGTAVAGILGANIYRGEGVAGICGQCQIFIFDGTLTYNFFRDVYLAGELGIHVINISMGIPQYFIILESAIHLAHEYNDILFCVSAGNLSLPNTNIDNCGPIEYPARFAFEGTFSGFENGYSNVISVGASDFNDDIAYYSKRGCNDEVEISVVAPGGAFEDGCPPMEAGDVYTTMPDYDYLLYGCVEEYTYGYFAGTSAAAPVVSGICGLLLSSNPDYTASELRFIIERSAEDVNRNTTYYSIDHPEGYSGAGIDIFMGHGRVNAHRAIRSRYGTLDEDMVWQNDIFVIADLIVPDGLTLTVSQSSTVYMGDNSIIVEEGATLDVQSGANFIAEGPDAGITVYGDMYADGAAFTAENGLTWSGITITGSNAAADLDNCTIEHANQINVQNGGTLNLIDSVISGGDYGVGVSYGVRVTEGEFTIQGNTISAVVCAIDVSLCQGSKNIILGNEISMTNTGINIYDSVVKLGSMLQPTEDQNLIHDNQTGLVVMNNSQATLYGNEIFHNDVEEIHFDHSCRFEMDQHYNQAYDDRTGHQTDPLIICSNHDLNLHRPHAVRYNYWGNYDEPKRFIPDDSETSDYDAYDVRPMWEPPPFSMSEQLYLQAGEAVENEDYQTAKSLYQQVANEFPDSEEARAGIGALYYVEHLSMQDFAGLLEYYENYPHRYIDEAMAKATDHFITRCQVDLGNYPAAIGALEAIIQNPPTEEDQVFSVIDLGYVYLEMAENDSAAGPQSTVGTMPELRPISRETHLALRDELLAQLMSGEPIELPGGGQTSGNFPACLLEQNYPNPFNPLTTIGYQLPAAGHVSLKVYNTSGQLVRTLLDQEQDAGKQSVVWDGRNDNGRSVSSGLYFYRLDSNGVREQKRMVLMK